MAVTTRSCGPPVCAALPSVTAPAVVAMQLFLLDALDGLHRIPGRARFDLIARDIQVDLAVAPTNPDDGIGLQQNMLAKPPVPGGYDQVTDVPIDIVCQKILDMADITVGCVYVSAIHHLHAAQVGVLVGRAWRDR